MSNQESNAPNQSELTGAKTIICEKCDEPLMFAFADKKGNEFSIGISMVLDCLEFAIEEGELPPLPDNWLSNVRNQFQSRIEYECSNCDEYECSDCDEFDRAVCGRQDLRIRKYGRAQEQG